MEEEKRAVFEASEKSAGIAFAEIGNVNRTADVESVVVAIIAVAAISTRSASRIALNVGGVEYGVS